jgi:hypothetical protein
LRGDIKNTIELYRVDQQPSTIYLIDYRDSEIYGLALIVDSDQDSCFGMVKDVSTGKTYQLIDKG